MKNKPPKKAGRIYAGVEPEQRKAERRQSFIQAGIRLIGEEGYRNVTVRGLCAAAGLTDRYYYESFDNTEALLIAIYDQLMAALRERLLLVFMSTDIDPRERAKRVLDVYFGEVRNPLFARISLIEILGVSPAVDQRYIDIMHQFSAILAQLVRQLNPAAQLDAVEEEIIGASLSGAVVMAAAGWMLQGYRHTPEQMADNVLKVLLGTARQLQLPQPTAKKSSAAPKRRSKKDA